MVTVWATGGLTQPQIDLATETLKAEINKAVRFPSITEIKVNGITAVKDENGEYNALLSTTCKTADFNVKTNFSDGVMVTVSDGVTNSDLLSFTESQKAYTVTLTYNNQRESYTVNAVRGTKHTVIALAGENGSITNAGVNYVDNGSSLSFTVAADEGYCVKNFTIDGSETVLPADMVQLRKNLLSNND